MSQFKMNASSRDRAGKGVARKLRREGRTPAVIYGGETAPQLISMDTNEINVEYYKGHMMTNICSLAVDGKEEKVIARDVGLHPVTDFVEHVDFLRVTDKTRVTVPVPINVLNFEGSPAEKEGAVVSIAAHEVMIECRATRIPDVIEIDLAEAEIGTTIFTETLDLPERTKLALNTEGQNILTVEMPRKMAEPEPEEEMAEGAEAEVPADNGGDDAEASGGDETSE